VLSKDTNLKVCGFVDGGKRLAIATYSGHYYEEEIALKKDEKIVPKQDLLKSQQNQGQGGN
jgi:hypothetical protein